jgi:3-phenylpropionate/cinnamic acid dioxygenase small subunit
VRAAELAFDTSGLVRSTMQDHYAVTTFLVDEAEVLDRGAYRRWLDFLSEDVVYRMPVRVTVAHTLADSLLKGMDHFLEDRYSLVKRVERFETDHAWTEDPPSRTRRFVTNIRVWAGDEDGLVAKSYLLLFRSRGDTRPPEWVSVERTDILRRIGQGLQIAERLVVVDESVLRTQNLAVFL